MSYPVYTKEQQDNFWKERKELEERIQRLDFQIESLKQQRQRLSRREYNLISEHNQTHGHRREMPDSWLLAFGRIRILTPPLTTGGYLNVGHSKRRGNSHGASSQAHGGKRTSETNPEHSIRQELHGRNPGRKRPIKSFPDEQRTTYTRLRESGTKPCCSLPESST